MNEGIEGPGIIDALAPLATPIDDLVEWDQNPRHGDDPSVKNSLKTFGQMSPIIYRREDNVRKVFAGNTRYRAAKALGWDHIAAIDSAHLDADQIRAFALADNRTSELGTYDEEMLLTVIRAVESADADLLAAASFTELDIAKLMPDDDGEVPDSFGDVDGDDIDGLAHSCPRCGFEFD